MNGIHEQPRMALAGLGVLRSLERRVVPVTGGTVVELSWAGTPVSLTMQVAMHRNAVSNSSTESKAVLFRKTSTALSPYHGWPPRSMAATAFPLLSSLV
jgi:hypothetical protein